MNDLPVVFVTGAASGIDRAVAEALRDSGAYQLVLADIDLVGLEATFSADDRVACSHLDVTDRVAWQTVVGGAVERYGRLDIMLNVAGVIRPGYVYNDMGDFVDYHIDVNVKGVMYGSQFAAAQMVKQGFGHIINIASLAGIAPVPGLSQYTASKFAVRGYTLAIANELKPKGVAVTSICPGLVDTPMLDLQLEYEEAAITFSNGRALTLDEIVKTVLRAIDKKPLELCPPSGFLPKLTSFFPKITPLAEKLMRPRGRSAQLKEKQKRRSD